MLKVYYKYSNNTKLEMLKGDLINECNQIESISRVADVYYDHREYLGNYKFADTKVARDYDVYIIRANEEDFNNVPKGKKKIWIASPYNIDCFRNADILATFSVAWELALKKGMQIQGLNPDGEKFSNARSIHQCLGDHFKPVESPLVEKIKADLGHGLIIGHFGSVRAITYPRLLQIAWPEIRRNFKGAKVLAGITKAPFPLPEAINRKISYTEMPSYISACDIIFLSQHGVEWEVCGNLKVKEAAACGIPIILEESAARIEELGRDFPLFLPRGTFQGKVTASKVRLVIQKIRTAITLKEELQGYLVQRMDFYSIKNNARRWNILLDRLINKE